MALDRQTIDAQFDLNNPSPTPNAFIQWKGTDVCLDFRCECGANIHIDAMFLYTITCEDCGVTYEMPTTVFLRRKAAS